MATTLDIMWRKMEEIYVQMQDSDSPTTHAIQAIRFETLAEMYATITESDKLQVMKAIQDSLEG